MTIASLSLASILGIIAIRHLSEWLSRRDNERDGIPPSFITYGDEP
ncbi:hypothetical protein HNR01_001737 [Methylorubrum rhodesianum]|nr:hypothetical protein [Methylorubrum rhodesianum]MBB5762117.1 hypothetical protein [Methylorubrum rhodesianum]